MLIQPARAYTIVWTPSRSCHVVGRMRSACVGGSAATNEVLHGPRLRTRSLVVTSLTSFLLYAVNKLGRARPTEPTTARTLHNNAKPVRGNPKENRNEGERSRGGAQENADHPVLGVRILLGENETARKPEHQPRDPLQRVWEGVGGIEHGRLRGEHPTSRTTVVRARTHTMGLRTAGHRGRRSGRRCGRSGR